MGLALYSKKTFTEFKAMLQQRQEEQKQGSGRIRQRLEHVEKQIDEKAKKIRRIASLMSDLDPKRKEDKDALDAFRADMRLASQIKADFDQELAELQEKLLAMQPITDDEILDVLLIRQRDIEPLQSATFEEKRR